LPAGSGAPETTRKAASLPMFADLRLALANISLPGHPFFGVGDRPRSRPNRVGMVLDATGLSTPNNQMKQM